MIPILNSSDPNKVSIEKSKRYIEEHFAESGLTLEFLAREVNISSTYFSALFKQTTGQSFINYVTSTRLKAAKKLLMVNGYKSYEVAMMCGYENATYFSTIFKRHVGMSPSEYREYALAEEIKS